MLIFLFCIFFFQKINLESIRITIELFLKSIMPSLFLFILFSNVLLQIDIKSGLKKVFKNNYAIVFIAIIGFICGYPMGAKAINEYLDKKEITTSQAKFLLTFANNASPIFILSTIGITMFNNIYFGIILAISHYLASLIICVFSLFHKDIIHESKTFLKSNSNNSDKKLHKTIFEALNVAIKNTYYTLSQILAYLILFNILSDELSYILKCLQLKPNYIYIIQSLFESTNGIKNIIFNCTYNTNTILILSSFALGFSGLSIIFQIYSCIYTKRINIFYIMKYKLIQGLLSSIITYLLVNIKFKPSLQINTIISNEFTYFIIIVSLLFIFAASIKKVTKKLIS